MFGNVGPAQGDDIMFSVGEVRVLEEILAASDEMVAQASVPAVITSGRIVSAAHAPFDQTAQAGKCLHEQEAGHVQPCVRCPEAPAFADFAAYELTGVESKKNGSKILRTRLVQSPEWKSPDVRRDTAKVAIEHGYRRLAVALIDCRSALMNKEEMLALSRMWNYRSCIWQRRGGRARDAWSTDDLVKAEDSVQAPVATSSPAAAAAGPAGSPVAAGAAAAGPLGASRELSPAGRSSGDDLLDAPSHASMGASGGAGSEAVDRAEETSRWNVHPTRATGPAVSWLDRTSVVVPFEASLALLALQSNTIPRLRDIGDRVISERLLVRDTYAPLIMGGQGGGYFNMRIAQALRDSATKVASLQVAALYQIQMAASHKILLSQAPYPPWLGTVEELGEEDRKHEAVFRTLRNNFAAVKETFVRMKAQRTQPVGRVQEIWEDSYITSMGQHDEMLSTTLIALALARSETSTLSGQLTFAKALGTLAEYFAEYSKRLNTCNLYCADWVEQFARWEQALATEEFSLQGSAPEGSRSWVPFVGPHDPQRDMTHGGPYMTHGGPYLAAAAPGGAQQLCPPVWAQAYLSLEHKEALAGLFYTSFRFRPGFGGGT